MQHSASGNVVPTGTGKMRCRAAALQGSSLKRALTGGGGDLGGLAQALEQHAQKLGLKQENRVDWGSQ